MKINRLQNPQILLFISTLSHIYIHIYMQSFSQYSLTLNIISWCFSLNVKFLCMHHWFEFYWSISKGGDALRVYVTLGASCTNERSLNCVANGNKCINSFFISSDRNVGGIYCILHKSSHVLKMFFRPTSSEEEKR